MNKKLIATLLCLLAVVMVFAGCQGPETSATPVPSNGPDVEIVMNAGDKYTIYFCNTKVENQWVDGVTGTRAAEARQRWLDFQEEYGVEITYIADTVTTG